LTSQAADRAWLTWSPDSCWVAYVERIHVGESSSSRIVKTRICDKREIALTDWCAEIEEIECSHDGKWIVYVKKRGDDVLAKVPFDGGPEDTLVTPGYAETPKWSYDGQCIAYTATGNEGYDRICVMSSDGARLLGVVDVGGDVWHPTWSPSDRKIAFIGACPPWSKIGLWISDTVPR